MCSFQRTPPPQEYAFDDAATIAAGGTFTIWSGKGADTKAAQAGAGNAFWTLRCARVTLLLRQMCSHLTPSDAHGVVSRGYHTCARAGSSGTTRATRLAS